LQFNICFLNKNQVLIFKRNEIIQKRRRINKGKENPFFNGWVPEKRAKT